MLFSGLDTANEEIEALKTSLKEENIQKKRGKIIYFHLTGN